MGELPVAVTPLVVGHRLRVHGLQQLQHGASAAAARRLQSTGSTALEHGLGCVNQGSGIKPMSPALAGELFTLNHW